jgi:hypothetical protein
MDEVNRAAHGTGMHSGAHMRKGVSVGLNPRRVAAAVLGVGLLGVSAASAAAQRNPLRDAFFGETHVHTSWSFDAYIFGNTMTGPEDAYKYARGETINHPMGYPIKITRPLD